MQIFFIYLCSNGSGNSWFGILRESCGGEPFNDCPSILRICNEFGKMDAVIKDSGDIFEKAPI